MKSASSRRSPRPATRTPVRTPDGLDHVYGVHALESLLARGESPKELWVQQGAGLKSGFSDEAYTRLGVKIAPDRDEVLGEVLDGGHDAHGASP